MCERERGKTYENEKCVLRVAETKVCVRERQEGRKRERERERERWAIERERKKSGRKTEKEIKTARDQDGE